MTFFLQLTFSGLALGCLYAVVAFGFVIVFKATGVLNFAHGELFMLGAYLASFAIAGQGLPILVTLILILLVTTLLGAGIHFGIMRGMVGEQLFIVVLATIGIAIVMKAGVQLLFGAQERGRVRFLPEGRLEAGDLIIPYVDLATVATAIVLVALLTLLFRRTKFGLQMRAVADNFEASKMVGINPQKIFAASWILGAVLAGVGGALYSNYSAVISLSLAGIGLRVFPVALIGGLTSFVGAVVGGLIVGVTEQLAVGYLGAEWRDVTAFGLMLIVLVVRPYGLFGKREVIRV